MASRILLAFLTALIVISSAHSENGRLPDGRAFRVDAAGNEIVDYIAELEVSIDTLNRQIDSLRSELEQKSVALTTCRAGLSPSLKERDIGAHKQISSEACDSVESMMAVELASLRDEKDIQMVEMKNDLEACRTLIDVEVKMPNQDQARAGLRRETVKGATQPPISALPVPRPIR